MPLDDRGMTIFVFYVYDQACVVSGSGPQIQDAHSCAYLVFWYIVCAPPTGI